MIAVAKITSKGQTTLPAEVRAKLNVKPGDHVRYVEMDDGGLRIEKVSSSLESLRGIIKLDRPIGDAELTQWIEEVRGRMGDTDDRP